MSDDMITGGEFGRFRADFSAWRSEVLGQMHAGFGGVNARLDAIAKGEADNSRAIAVLEGQVENLTANGCAQYDEHRHLISDVVVPKLDASGAGWRSWHPAAKGAAGVGGFAALATLLELVRQVLQHFGI